jgi:5-hydroxyisourate hydrolase
MTLSTHVLDLAAGRPAAGIPVRAERWEGDWRTVGSAVTDGDGRIAALVSPEAWSPGRWRVTFDIAHYLGSDALFHTATVELNISSPDRIHLPLLLSPFGYTTYRGS